MEDNEVEDFVKSLHLAFDLNNVTGPIDDPIFKLEDELFKTLDKKQKSLYMEIQNLKRKRNNEKVEKAIEFTILNIDKVFKWEI